MKTIGWLNEHWWYRLVKVIYLLFFILSGGMAIWVNFNSVGNYQTDYFVVCNYGNQSTFLANKDKGIYYIPTWYDYTASLSKLPDDTKEQIQRACGISSDDAVNIVLSNIAKDEHHKLFDLTQTKINVTTHWVALVGAILSIMAIVLMAEIVRRIFYYIFLGSVRPKKNEE